MKTWKQGFATKGVDISKLQSIEVGTNTTPLLSGVQEVQGVVISKYVALLHGDSTTLVTYNVLNRDELTERNVIEPIKLITIGSEIKVEDKIKNLSFKFEAFSPFKLADILTGSSAILTTFDGVDPT